MRAAHVLEKDASTAAIYRAVFIWFGLYPSRPTDVAPCKYEIIFDEVGANTNVNMHDNLYVNDITFYTSDIPIMIFLAYYFRGT